MCGCGPRNSTYQASVSIRQHTSAYISIRQRTSDVRVRRKELYIPSIRQHPSVSMRQHTSAYVSVRQMCGCGARNSIAPPHSPVPIEGHIRHVAPTASVSACEAVAATCCRMLPYARQCLGKDICDTCAYRGSRNDMLLLPYARRMLASAYVSLTYATHAHKEAVGYALES
jgi:hypothetical protein